MMMKRLTGTNAASAPRVAAYAANGVVNAAPEQNRGRERKQTERRVDCAERCDHRRGTRRWSTRHASSSTVDGRRRCPAFRSVSRASRSTGASSWIDPMTGHDASPSAIVIAVAASIPGATNSMYGTPRDVEQDWFTSVPESDTERAEVEDRVDDARHRRAAPDCAGTASPSTRRREAGARRAHSSTSVRPVRWRNTSSRVERRTSTLSGSQTELVDADAVASPSSV